MTGVTSVSDAATRPPAASGALPPPPDVPRAVDRGRRGDRIAALALGALAVAVGAATMGPWPVGVFWDDGVYVILAKALATGEGLRYMHIPGEPSGTHYPPAYPMLLALLWKLSPSFPGNVALFKLANAVMLGVTAGASYLFARRRLVLRPAAAAAASFGFSVCIPTLVLAGVLMSETMFAALLIPSLWAGERAAERGGAPWAAGAGALAGLLGLVRTIGVFALPALLLVLLVRRRFREAGAALAAALALLLPWQLWVGAHVHELPTVIGGSYGPYLAWLVRAVLDNGLPFVWEVARQNCADAAKSFAVLFSPLHPLAFKAVAVALFLGFLAAGVWRMARLAPVAAAFVVMYLGVVIVWPYNPERFIWAVWPLLGLVLAAGFAGAWRWRPAPGAAGRSARIAALAGAAFVAAGYLRYNARGAARRWWESPQRVQTEATWPIVQWVVAATSPDDVISGDGHVMVYLYTGRRAVPTAGFLPEEHTRPLTLERRVADLREIIRVFGAKYVVVPRHDPATAAVTSFLTRTSPPELRQLGQLPNGTGIYVPKTPPPPAGCGGGQR